MTPRQQLADWMIKNGFATGHGDHFYQLLDELAWQVQELRSNLPVKIRADDFQGVLCDLIEPQEAKWVTAYLRERWPYPIEVTE